ncbi:unnamed protein product [Blepharisma stoltei]|uniref:Uncharacterized protein n=1 Tax=Blepharisma stoltei TaxID=1481888 RepID=A0AAU9K2G6_9CILI|nr:unnamed protein product [Blepharisma stoltei]
MLKRRAKKNSTLRASEEIYLPNLHRSQLRQSLEPIRGRSELQTYDISDVIKSTTQSIPIRLPSRNDFRRTSMPTKREVLTYDNVIIPISMRKKVLKKQLPPLSESISDGSDIASISPQKLTNQTTTEIVYSASNQIKKSINRIKKLIKKNQTET